MAHQKRASLARELADRYNAGITWDRHSSRWDTGRRAWWSLASSPDSHALVLQDDAQPARRFHVGLPEVLAQVPEDSPLVLYAGSTRRWRPTFEAIPRNTSFLVMDRIWWGVGIILPVKHIEAAIKVGDELAVSGHDQYDHMLGAFFYRESIPVYYTWPSIVDHWTGPSLIAGRTGRRRAYRFSRRPVTYQKWSGRQVKVDTPELAEMAYLNRPVP